VATGAGQVQQTRLSRPVNSPFQGWPTQPSGRLHRDTAVQVDTWIEYHW